MASSKIDWTEKVWNVLTGCSKVSEGCRNCYAERMVKRLAGRYGYSKENPFRITFHLDRLHEPEKWGPCRIFVSSMGDLFHKDVPFDYITRILDVIASCPQHTFLLLTKRPERMAEVFRFWNGADFPSGGAWPLPNVWLGVSVEDQKTADERIPPLLEEIPAEKRFISYEPALGPLDLGHWFKCAACKQSGPPGCKWCENGKTPIGINLVIVGGETSPKARPVHPDWIRKIRDDCAAAGIPWFFKSWGEWAPSMYFPESQAKHTHVGFSGETSDEGLKFTEGGVVMPLGGESSCGMVRVGHKLSGHMLDGKEYLELPE